MPVNLVVIIWKTKLLGY